jgi:hypothetical protein
VQHHEILRYDDPHRVFDDGAPIARSSMHRKRGKSGISASRDTRIPTSICTCSTWRGSTAFCSTPCRCR